MDAKSRILELMKKKSQELPKYAPSHPHYDFKMTQMYHYIENGHYAFGQRHIGATDEELRMHLTAFDPPNEKANHNTIRWARYALEKAGYIKALVGSDGKPIRRQYPGNRAKMKVWVVTSKLNDEGTPSRNIIIDVSPAFARLEG